MAFQDLLPWVEADAQRDEARNTQWRDAQRTQTIGNYMATANQIRRQLGYVDNLQKALALTLDPNTHKPAAGHEQEAARLQQQLGQYDVNALHGNLNQVESYIQKLYDPNFNAETGMPGRSPIRALGEKLHLVRPQATPLAQPAATRQQPPQPAPEPPLPAEQFRQGLLQGGVLAPPQPQRTMMRGPAPQGLIAPGNINLDNRPVVRNPDGSVSTVRSMNFGVEENGREIQVLVPTVINGRVVSNQEAMDHYRQTGQFLGKFDTPQNAVAYSQALHNEQAQQYNPGAAQFGQTPRKTAGEIIRDLQSIRQKYDIAAPGIETGEKELAGEAAQREKELATERDIEFAQREGKKVGASEEEIRGIALGKLGGYKPTAPKTQFDVMQGTVDGQPVTWQRNKYTGEVQTLTGDPVPDDQLNKFQAAPKGGKGAAKPRHAWSKDKNGRIFSVLLDPATNQIVPNSENYDEQPPASLTGRISTGQYHFVDTEGNVHEIRETRTSMPAGGAGGPAARGGAGAGAGAAPGDKIIGHKDTPESTAAKKIADLMETDANSANDYMQSRKAGQKSPTSDSALVISWVRSQVRGAGRLTNTEIEYGLRSGSYETRFSNAWNKALSGTLDDTFVENMITDINRGARAARETADKYKTGAGQTAPSGGKKRVSLKKAMSLPQYQGKSEAEVRKAIEDHGYEVAP